MQKRSAKKMPTKSAVKKAAVKKSAVKKSARKKAAPGAAAVRLETGTIDHLGDTPFVVIDGGGNLRIDDDKAYASGQKVQFRNVGGRAVVEEEGLGLSAAPLESGTIAHLGKTPFIRIDGGGNISICGDSDYPEGKKVKFRNMGGCAVVEG